jgi:hypothetical protein
MTHDLVAKNVAALQRPPRIGIDAEEMQVLSPEKALWVVSVAATIRGDEIAARLGHALTGHETDTELRNKFSDKCEYEDATFLRDLWQALDVIAAMRG